MSLWKGREMCLRGHKRALPKLFRSGRILWLYQFKMYRKLFIKCLPVAIRCLVHELIYFFIHSFMYLCIYYFLYLFIYYIKHIYNTLRSQLVSPKEKTSPEKKTGLVYNFACNSCGEHYIRQTARSQKRLSEHQKNKQHQQSRSTSPKPTMRSTRRRSRSLTRNQLAQQACVSVWFRSKERSILKIEERDFRFWLPEKSNLSSPAPPRSFTRAIFRGAFDSRSFIVLCSGPKQHGKRLLRRLTRRWWTFNQGGHPYQCP